ncbi:hypothetical protein BsWGS_00244 [Bradybaena similaris]
MDNCSVLHNLSKPCPEISEIYVNHSLSVTIDRVVTPVFYIIGLPANPLCAYIWLQRKTRANNSSAIYLGALSISHVVFLFLHILQELRYAWGIRTYDGYISCEIFNMVFCIPQYLAPLLVLGFTVERYIAVCHPFAKERYCTVFRAVLVVVCLLVFCILISTLQAYFWTYDEKKQICNHRPELYNSPLIEIWTWFTELLLFGVAPLAALVFNILVIREIRSLTSSGPAHIGGSGSSQASTVTLLSVSFFLICTWLPYTIIYSMSKQFPIGNYPIALEAVWNDPTWQKHFFYVTIRNFVAEITLSNSACYFFIYYATGKHFRDKVHELLCPAQCTNASNRNHHDKAYMSVSKNSHFNGTSATCV